MAYSSGEKEEALPLELTDQICSYLEAEDLLSLSATNSFWRNVVNRDCIWKPLCVRYFDVNPFGKPLIDRKCRVDPPFEVVTNSSQKLSDICMWRIRFAQEIYVLTNWKLKRFHTEDLTEEMPSLWLYNYFIYGNFAVLYPVYQGSIQIWKLTDDGFIKMEIIALHENEQQVCGYNIYPLGNGFVVVPWPFIYYYELNEDGFQLKIRTLVTKALHPEIPVLADPSQIDESHFEEFKDKPYYRFSTVVNDRYAVISNYNDECFFFIIWDLQNYTTFSYTITCVKVDRSEIFLVEGESSILYLHFITLGNVGSTIYILKIQNSRIDILNIHNIMKPVHYGLKMAGDSLAIMYNCEIVFLARDGTTRSFCCFDVQNLINCRSFYVVQTPMFGGVPGTVVSIDKKNFSTRIIQQGIFVSLKSYFKRSSFDLIIFTYFDAVETSDHNHSVDENKTGEEAKNALYDLRTSDVISWSNEEYKKITNFLKNDNKIILCSYTGKRVNHFW